MKLLVKTPRGLERIVASRLAELLPSTSTVISRPKGYLGLVLVETTELTPERILNELPEIEKLFVIEEEVPADLERICEASVRVAERCIRRGESFAVRTTRRGRHGFTSIDVNVRAGACIQGSLGNPVDLSYPDKIIWVEIINDRAYIACTRGDVEHKKKYPGKPDIKSLLEKIVVVQMPYLGDIKGARNMGIRIGRAAQTFGIKALYISPYYRVDAFELKEFIAGVEEGIRSRLTIQERTGHLREVKPVPVFLQDLYQFVRDHKDEGIIVTSTRGKALREVSDKLRKIFEEKEKVNVLIGSREGIPTGVFRFADLIIDVAPGITLATDVAFSSIITALIWCLLQKEE